MKFVQLSLVISFQKLYFKIEHFDTMGIQPYGKVYKNVF